MAESTDILLLFQNGACRLFSHGKYECYKAETIYGKQRNKVFPVYLWLVTKNLNKQTEFKIGEKDGVLGYFDTLTPIYASFHDDDKTFSFMWTEYNGDFGEFYRNYIENQRSFGENHGVLCQPLMKTSIIISPLLKRGSFLKNIGNL